jgi:uncharacterized lipoprotein YajG
MPHDELNPNQRAASMKTVLGILAIISLLAGCAYPNLKCNDPDVRPSWCDDTGGLISGSL